MATALGDCYISAYNTLFQTLVDLDDSEVSLNIKDTISSFTTEDDYESKTMQDMDEFVASMYYYMVDSGEADKRIINLIKGLVESPHSFHPC